VAALQIIRTDGAAAGHDPQTDWHLDTFHATAKAWLFLHAVQADQGPLAYIPGSHRATPAHAQWEHAQSQTAARDPNYMHSSGSLRIEEADLNALGYERRYQATVAPNTLVIADTGGFHRRTPSPQATTRVEIYFSLRRNPFFAGFVPSVLSLPGLKRYWASVFYGYCSMMWAIGKPDWIPRQPQALYDDERRLLGE
jgi:hypothetical protein